MPAASPVYDSARRGLRFVEEASDLWRYRHLVVELVRRDIKVRYKRSVLGIGWSMLSPLLQMIAMTWVFSVVIRQDIRNFPVYFLSGSVFWAFFAQATGHAATLTLDASEMGKRIFLPRSVFVLSAVGVALVNFVLSLIPLILIVLWSGDRIHLSWLFLPVSILIGTGFAFGVGLFVFTLASRFVDVKEMYLILVQVWFFVTPIVYAPKLVPPEYRYIVRYNPMTYLVEIFRAPLYDGWLPGLNTLAFAFLAACASLVIGWTFYAAKIEDYGTRS
jgi:ABC-type polysaccharide/polyol phosphate export permease